MSEQNKLESLAFFNKPSGVSTHRPSHDRLGFVEWASQRDAVNYKVCHRLDKDTSGALVFAKTKEAAAQLTQLFENHEVKKEYLFLSDKKSKDKEWTVEKTKDARGDERPFEEGTLGFSSTRFERISDQGTLFLYKAYPLTGKTHQIRKHAIHSGIPILGDTEYGGKPFPRLMLHALKISFVWNKQNLVFESPKSLLFEQVDLCLNSQLANWIAAIERRQTLYPKIFHSEQALRLCHTETGDLRIDQAGERLILGWWKSEKPNDFEIANIKKLMKIFNFNQWIFQWRPGVNQQDQLALFEKSSELQEGNWYFFEGDSKFLGSLDRGQNFGLFLDQRERRDWVLKNSSGKRVLNLFAFTCGFSLKAALGGAKKVVSVDLFKKYLEWGKENFALNGLEPEQSEFRAMDSLEYLKYAQKKGIQFDLIICDPPSFSRQKKSKKVFRVERDFKDLLKACDQLLTPGGNLLFSTNFERWPMEKWQAEIEKWAGSGYKVKMSPSQWDYEWQTQGANMKAFFLKKACHGNPPAV